ncbi:MAG: hypothetical protein UX89_C0004G0028 [Parcubacteria group bacterium GW2011_GWA2_47_16]|nr:MAG: hypothetical protein UX89_C0004G0028 [Parcubacteria group bacterium GW2011_GWA2_47_16]
MRITNEYKYTNEKRQKTFNIFSFDSYIRIDL